MRFFFTRGSSKFDGALSVFILDLTSCIFCTCCGTFICGHVKRTCGELVLFRRNFRCSTSQDGIWVIHVTLVPESTVIQATAVKQSMIHDK